MMNKKKIFTVPERKEIIYKGTSVTMTVDLLPATVDDRTQ